MFDTEFKYKALRAAEAEKNDEETKDGDVEMTEKQLDKREEVLKSHPDRVRRMGNVLIPTLIELYSSTVHLRVRQRAIHALVKLIYFTNDSLLQTILEVSRQVIFSPPFFNLIYLFFPKCSNDIILTIYF